MAEKIRRPWVDHNGLPRRAMTKRDREFRSVYLLDDLRDRSVVPLDKLVATRRRP